MFKYRAVLDPQDSNVQPVQVFRAPQVIFGGDCIEMLLPVEFDRQIALRAVEVHHIVADTVLSAEFLAFQF